MKKIILTTLVASALAASSFAQGTISAAISSGTNLVRIDGVAATAAQNARVEILWAPQGTADVNQYVLLGAPISVGVPLAGFFNGGVRTIPAGTGFAGIAPGAIVSLVVRAWTLGSGATYDLATAKGRTNPFDFNTADPTAQPAPEAPSNMNGIFPGVNIIVPEPSSMALAGLGAASLLIFRRRK
jgi:hypothetical protein